MKSGAVTPNYRPLLFQNTVVNNAVMGMQNHLDFTVLLISKNLTKVW